MKISSVIILPSFKKYFFIRSVDLESALNPLRAIYIKIINTKFLLIDRIEAPWNKYRIPFLCYKYPYK